MMEQNEDLQDGAIKGDVFVFEDENWVSLSQRTQNKEQVSGNH